MPKPNKTSKRVSPNLVYSYLISKGVTSQHALGMMANIRHESNFIPDAKGDSGTSAGLFMHHNTRYEGLKKYTGGDLTNWKKQIDYALSESDTKNYLKQKFKTPEEASYWFTTKWERPENASTKAVQRQGWIKEFMQNRGKDWQMPTFNPEGLTEEQIYASNLPQVEGEYQPEVPADILAQQTKRDQEVENLRAENKRLTEKEDADLAAEREKESKEKQELLAAEEEQMKQTQFADALAEVTPQSAYKPTDEFVGRNPEMYKQNLGFEVQQAQNLFQSSIPATEVQEAKYGGYFEDGGEVDDSVEFNDFYQSLPISLQTEDNLDNLHSLWVESGKVSSYDEIDTPDNFDFERQVLEYGDGGPISPVVNTSGPRDFVPGSTDYDNYEPSDEEKAWMMSNIVRHAGQGNKAAIRMMNENTKDYTFTGDEYDEQMQRYAGVPAGEKGTHFSASMGNSFVPFIQEGEDGELYYNGKANPNDTEAIPFDSEQEAEFFANYYKKANPPMMREWTKNHYTEEEYGDGGKKPYVTTDPKEYAYRKKMYNDSLNLYNFSTKKNKLKQAQDLKAMKSAEGSKNEWADIGKLYSVVPGSVRSKTQLKKAGAYDNIDFGDDYKAQNNRNWKVGFDVGLNSIKPYRYEKHTIDYKTQIPEKIPYTLLGETVFTKYEPKNVNTNFSNSYAVYKKPSQPVQLAKKKLKEEIKPIIISTPPVTLKKEEVLRTAAVVKTPTTEIAKVESKPTTSYPAGYAPYSLYGKVLDPEKYGYAPSTTGKPVQVAQFADTYNLKQKMDNYKKEGKTPWGTTFDLGGTFDKLLDPNNINAFKQKYGLQ